LFELLLHGDNPQVRRRAAELLGHLNIEKTDTDRSTIADALIESIATEDEVGVRTRAIEALDGHGEAYIEQLIDELATSISGDSAAVTRFFHDWVDSEHPEFRMVAVSSFRRFGGDDVIPSLREAFEDPDPRVRARAVEAYGHRGSVPAAPVQSLLGDGYAHVRRAAARALATIGDRDALQRLGSVARDDDETVRRVAVEHLRRLDTERSVTVLLESLSDPSGDVRRQALLSLLQLARDGESVDAAEICRKIREDSTVPSSAEAASRLDELLAESAKSPIRRTAVRVLGRLAVATDRPELRDRLIRRLDDRDEQAAEAAADHLREMDARAIEKPLQLLVQDEETSAAGRRRAESILEAIRDEAATALEGKSIEYTRVSDPAEYPLDRGREIE
jgi:HEAT repeat protein